MPQQGSNLKYCRLLSSAPLADRVVDCGVYSSKDSEQRSCFYLIEVTSPFFQTSKAPAIIKETLSRAFFLPKEKESPVYQFESMVKKVNSALASLAKRGETEWIGALSAAILEINGNEVFITQTGNVAIYLFRQLKISHLSEGLQTETAPHPLKTFSTLISGTLKYGDRLVVGNQTLFDYVSLDLLRQLVLSFSPARTANHLARQFRKEKVKTVCALFLEIQEPQTKPGKESEVEPEVIYLEHLNKNTLFKIFGSLYRYLKTYWPKIKKLLLKLPPLLQKIYFELKRLSKKIRRHKLEPASRRPGQAFPLLTNRLKDKPKSFQAKFFNLKKLLPYLYITVAIIIATAGIFAARRANLSKVKTQQEIQVQEEQLSLAKDYFKNGDLALINKDEKKAKEAFSSAQKILEKIELPAKQKEINDLKTEIQRKIDAIDKVFRFSNLQPKFNLQGINAQQVIYTDRLYAFDPQEGSLYLLETLNSKPEQILKDENLKDAKLFVLSNDEVIALSKLKLYLINLQEKTLSEFTLSPSTFSLADVTKIVDFTGNLYLLDQKQNQVWRVNRRDLDLGIPVDFIKETDKASIFRSMAIDGNVWTLSKENIQSWSKGKLNLTIPLGQIPQGGALFEDLITSSDFAIYLIDKNQARIAELKKDGSYSRELFVEGLKTPVKDIFIKLKNKKAYFLTDEGVYIIGL